MLDLIKDNKEKYSKIILENLKDYAYRCERYQIDFALIISYCDESIDISNSNDHKRQTDKIIVLEKNLLLIILDSITVSNAIKVASSSHTKFQSKYFSKDLFTCIVASKDYNDNSKMIKSLFNILEYAVSNNMCNAVIDDEQLLIQKH